MKSFTSCSCLSKSIKVDFKCIPPIFTSYSPTASLCSIPVLFILLGHHVIFQPKVKKKMHYKFIVIYGNCAGYSVIRNSKILKCLFSLLLICLELSTFSCQVLLAWISISLTDHHGSQERRQNSNTVQVGPITEGNWNWFNKTTSVTDPIQQEHSTFIHVEMGFDAFWLRVCMLLKAAAYSRQFDSGQVQRAKHTAKHSQQGERKDLALKTFILWGSTVMGQHNFFVRHQTQVKSHYLTFL